MSKDHVLFGFTKRGVGMLLICRSAFKNSLLLSVSYNGVDDCVEKALFYLDHPDERSTYHAGQYVLEA